MDRLGLDCKNVEKVRKLADKIPEKYNKVENTIFDNISPEGIEYDKWKNSLEFIPNITHTDLLNPFLNYLLENIIFFILKLLLMAGIIVITKKM